jgi:CDP-glycerol glycerophosphotransferase
VSLVHRARTVAWFALSHLGRRDPSVWVFGNQKGFHDNPRYLAEHLLHSGHGIRPWWIARSPAEAGAARAAGLSVAVRGTSRARRVQRRARVAFLSNGFADLEPAWLGGAFVVDLRHGKGLKRVLLDMDLAPPRRGFVDVPRRWARRWLAQRRLDRIGLIVAPGEMARQMYIRAYRCSPSKVRVLGTPRFDILLDEAAHRRACGHDVRERLGVRPDDHLVVWLPTWREDGDASWLPQLGADTFAAALRNSRALLLAKPHPYSDAAVFRERLPDHERFRIENAVTVDTNCLLKAADALITDFSSAAFDYALLDRPIHYFVPDLHRYRGGRGLYMPFEDLSGGRHHLAWKPLLEEVVRVAERPAPGDAANAASARALSGQHAAPGSCERIVAEVLAATGQGRRRTVLGEGE